MKGCEIQCGNRFHYLLIWPCHTVVCQSRRHWAAVYMCAYLTHFTRWGTKNRRPDFKPDKFMQIPAILWREYIKCVRFWYNKKKKEKGNERSKVESKGKAMQHKAKPLVRYKGQILDFYFLNNRHNCSTLTLIWMLPFKSDDGWKKGQVPGSHRSLDSVCTALYSWQSVSAALSLHHQFLSIFRKKKAFCFFK